MQWTLVKSVALMLTVFAIILFGVRKNDVDTQARISANTAATARLAHSLCVARNHGVVVSNARWARVKVAWATAAQARRDSADQESDPVQAKIDRDAARVYQNVSNSIHPYDTIPCA